MLTGRFGRTLEGEDLGWGGRGSGGGGAPGLVVVFVAREHTTVTCRQDNGGGGMRLQVWFVQKVGVGIEGCPLLTMLLFNLVVLCVLCCLLCK